MTVKELPSTESNTLVENIRPFVDLLQSSQTLVLSGAGISTESGIPDYRGTQSVSNTQKKIYYREFLLQAKVRQRYWARSLFGWQNMSSSVPNSGHQALSQLESDGFITGILTQNVDGLHQVAGSKNVLELHGNLSFVKCLKCGVDETRVNLQRRLVKLNPHIQLDWVNIYPDGDAEVAEDSTDNFNVPGCLQCGGLLKPEVVFFGENVPKGKVDFALEMLEQAGSLLVVGTSLTVFSGYRFVSRARKAGKPIGIINMGSTRGDSDALIRLHAPLGKTLTELALLCSNNR